MDGEESRLVFLDHPHGAIKLENLLNTYKYLHIYNIYNNIFLMAMALGYKSLIKIHRYR